jgi:hypothetical protein
MFWESSNPAGIFLFWRLIMLNLAVVIPKEVSFSKVQLTVLQMIYDYTTKLSNMSKPTVAWIPISQSLCQWKLAPINDGLICRAMAELDEDGYIETTKFNHSCPDCRCKWFRLTDKFYDLLKGINK